MQRWAVGVLLLVLFTATAGQIVTAQTATPLPTPTPEVRVMWTLEAGLNDLGTPYPAQDVIFSYSFDAGEAAIALFLGALIVLSVGGLVIWLFLSSRSEDSKANHGGRLTPAAPAPIDRRLAPRDRRDV